MPGSWLEIPRKAPLLTLVLLGGLVGVGGLIVSSVSLDSTGETQDQSFIAPDRDQATPPVPRLAPSTTSTSVVEIPIAPRSVEAIADSGVADGGDFKLTETETWHVNPSAARAPLKAYDRALSSFFKERRRIDYLSYAGDVGDCAEALMQRRGYDVNWVLQGRARIRLDVRDGVVRVASAELIEQRVLGGRPVDDEFRDCYRRAFVDLAFTCPSCRSGALEFEPILTEWVHKRGPDNLPPNLDPRQDPAFHRSAPIP